MLAENRASTGSYRRFAHLAAHAVAPDPQDRGCFGLIHSSLFERIREKFFFVRLKDGGLSIESTAVAAASPFFSLSGRRTDWRRSSKSIISPIAIMRV
jgi:hypothetical protein